MGHQLRYRSRCLNVVLNCEPGGHGFEFVSDVRTLVPLKPSVEEELMHVKYIEAQSPHVGVVWKFGMGVIRGRSSKVILGFSLWCFFFPEERYVLWFFFVHTTPSLTRKSRNRS
ncbi:hypothetical protein TNCV_4338591 [Trichonephila clavipes]|nr:hypothetical protein TNCV_4338591 [Trichonephila clavipes]